MRVAVVEELLVVHDDALAGSEGCGAVDSRTVDE
jgi:hypothetical protein